MTGLTGVYRGPTLRAFLGVTVIGKRILSACFLPKLCATLAALGLLLALGVWGYSWHAPLGGYTLRNAGRQFWSIGCARGLLGVVSITVQDPGYRVDEKRSKLVVPEGDWLTTDAMLEPKSGINLGTMFNLGAIRLRMHNDVVDYNGEYHYDRPAEGKGYFRSLEWRGFWLQDQELPGSPADGLFLPVPRLRQINVQLPFWFIALYFGALTAFGLWRLQKRRWKERHIRERLCLKCGYDLRAHNPGATCPECGTPVPTSSNAAPDPSPPPASSV